MDIYGMSSTGQDVFGVDDLFDFSGDRDDLFSSSTATSNHLFNNIASSTVSSSQFQYASGNPDDFTDHFCLPSDDVAELEWLSKFVDDSVRNFPANNIAGTINFRPENTSFHSRSRSKRTRAPSNTTSWEPTTQISETTSLETGSVRRCTHCASEKTPQWRTGPLGPKTLCNACGVRYKSGRLVPEYRPAASPTFVLTQHSNSHRKVMELRRQKEMMFDHHQQQVVSSEHQIFSASRHHNRQQQPQQQVHHGVNYEIC